MGGDKVDTVDNEAPFHLIYIYLFSCFRTEIENEKERDRERDTKTDRQTENNS